ncbi:MAG: LysR family transcriptional regulator [Rhodospirillaceae bacterium]
MRINYDFGDLEAFVALMETRSFHLAAERVSLSQPAVTRRIRKLEETLDAVLFERTTRSVEPTLAAKRFYERALALLADAQEATLAIRDESVLYAHQRNAVVTVATVPTVLAGWLAPAINRFRAQGHQARIRLLDRSANDVADAVAKGDADFGLCSMPAAPDPTVSFRMLFQDRLAAMLLADHPLAARESLRWSDLDGADLIVPARGTGNRLVIDDAMAGSRLPLFWAYEARRSTTALGLVRAGLGVAILPSSAFLPPEDKAGGPICARPLSDPEILRPMGILTRVGQVDAPATAQLLAELVLGAQGLVGKTPA